MTVKTALQTTQYRLARHYLNKLRSADEAVRKGQASVSYGFALFDQEWEQIRHWQAWAAERKGDDASKQLCKEFPLAGLTVLSSRTSAADHAVWLETALEAAQQLDDNHAERMLCHELEMIYYRLGRLEKVEYFAIQLLKLGEAACDSLSIGRGFCGLGIYAAERGVYGEAKCHYQRALEIFEGLEIDTETGRALNGLGSIALYLGDYQAAYRYFSRHLDLMEAAGKKSEFCTALLAIGEVLMSLKDYDGAEKYTRRAVEMCRALGFQRLLGVGLINLGALAIEQNQLEVACDYFTEGLEAVRAVNTQRQIIHGLSMLGYTQMRLGNYRLALSHLREGLQMACEAGMPRYICNLQRTLANTYLAVRDFDAARDALRESLSIAQSLDSYPQKVRTLSSVVAYYHGLGQDEQAAIWAGNIMDDAELDEALFRPVYLQLEAALGSEAYQKALVEGRMLKLDEIVREILTTLSRPD